LRDVSTSWATVTVEICKDKNNCDIKTFIRQSIFKHKKCSFHLQAVNLISIASKNKIEVAASNQETHLKKSTEILLRTAYYIAKNDRPFSDYESLVELQNLNGCKVGITLHSRYSAVEMVNIISDEMRHIVIKNIIDSNSKITLLTDESTALSRKACIVVFLKTVVNEGPPIFVFLDISELKGKKSIDIVESIMEILTKCGFTLDWLTANLIAFVSDGASVLLGKKNGVAAKLKEKFPNILTLHCMSHRLELAVGDSAKEVKGVDNFIKFVSTLHSIYSMSPKNVKELADICIELDVEMRKIGRVFDVRWVASSLRTVKAIWTSYEALYAHFASAANDETRLDKIRAKFRGLRNKLRSKNFVLNLAILYDILQELSNLSLKLQDRATDILLADRYINVTIRFLKMMTWSKDQHFTFATQAVEKMSFKNVSLTDLASVPKIDEAKLLDSLISNLSSRLLENSDEFVEILDNSKVLQHENWPKVRDGDELSIRHGEREIKSLCNKFRLDSTVAVASMREYIFDKTIMPKPIKEIKKCVETLACGTAECERGFSAMNLIVTDLRSLLTIKNVNSLMWIKINGPPVRLFDPQKYLRKWLNRHRDALDNKTRKVAPKPFDEDKTSMFSIL
jgi:hypothetical protein